MAYGYWPDYTPGSEYGPCAEPCRHKDCALLRAPDQGKCGKCGKPLETGDRFYFVDGLPVHAREEEEALCPPPSA
jgi:hypothetical protein